MYLSELCGRLNQILREHGDMEVVRHRSLKIDGIVGIDLDSFVNFSSDDFSVLEECVQSTFPNGSCIERKVGEKFIINIPL